MRVIIAVASPCPGLYGSKYDDVEKILGDDNASDLDARQQSFKLAMRKSAEWRARIDNYWILGPEDRNIAPRYQQLLSKIKEKDIAIGDISDIFSEIVGWRKKLRPGACDMILKELCGWFVEFWKQPDAADLCDAATCRSILECIKVTDPRETNKDLTALKTKATEAAMSKHSEHTVNELTKLVAGRPDLSSETDDVTKAFEACKGQSLPDALKQTVHDYKGLLLAEVAAFMGQDMTGQTLSYITSKLDQAKLIFSSIVDFDGSEEFRKKAGEPDDFCAVTMKSFAIAAQAWRSVKAIAEVESTELDANKMAGVLVEFQGVAANARKLQAEVADAAYGNVQHIVAATVTLCASQNVTDSTTRTITNLKQALAKAKQKLDRVAGGTEDGKSWKAELLGHEKLTDKKMQSALEVLKKAFFESIKKRMPPVIEVSLRISCSLLVIPQASFHNTGGANFASREGALGNASGRCFNEVSSHPFLFLD
jgi:hypothetical protein